MGAQWAERDSFHEFWIVYLLLFLSRNVLPFSIRIALFLYILISSSLRKKLVKIFRDSSKQDLWNHLKITLYITKYDVNVEVLDLKKVKFNFIEIWPNYAVQLRKIFQLKTNFTRSIVSFLCVQFQRWLILILLRFDVKYTCINV